VGYNNTPNVIVQIDNKAIREQQEKADRQTQVLNQGTSLITADQTTPLDIQVEGRTLVTLQNSNLAGDGTHVLANADKKTKVIVDNKSVSGVAKFTKNSTLTRKANFVGKVQQSLTENPNALRQNAIPNFVKVNETWGSEIGSTGYSKMQAIDGNALSYNVSTSGAFVQQTMSFDVIEEIERNMGRIPGADRAAKVQWAKDNIQTIVINYHGFGSGPSGNRVTLQEWLNDTSKWAGQENPAWVNTHTNGFITKSTKSVTNMARVIDSVGFIHFLANADASDGVTPSVINTDYVEIQIDLKSTAQLDTRPQIVRTANFDGKAPGSTVEVPHKSLRSESSGLLAPSVFTTGDDTPQYNNLGTLNGQTVSKNALLTGQIAQHLFSFDVIAEVERNIGRIPRATTADKVLWLRENLSRYGAFWSGYGTGPTGNRAYFSKWSPGASNWTTSQFTHANGTITKLGQYSTVTDYIDNTGFLHFLAHTDPSDGVTQSVIFSDYIELEIELKPGASLQDPQVPLYSVDSTEYANILGTWPEAEVLNRYPKVTGIQHVQNPYVMAEGENLLPPFSEWFFLHANAKIIGPYELQLDATGLYQYSDVWIPVFPNQQYSFYLGDIPNLYCNIVVGDANKNVIGGIAQGGAAAVNKTFTTPANAVFVRVSIGTNAAGQYNFVNPVMNIGPVAKPFTPRNPSYLFAQVKLGQIGSTKDLLYKQDGWKVRKVIEKDVILDGSQPWGTISTKTGFKTVRMPLAATAVMTTFSKATKYDGMVHVYDPGHANATLDVDRYFIIDLTGVSNIYFGVSNQDTGFGEGYMPLGDEWKAYFNGWKAKTVDVNGKPTSWRSLGDGVDAPTQTLAYVLANKAPNFTPYKLSYVLAAPVTEDVSDKIEGDITVAGITQVEAGSGVIVREKISPAKYQTAYYINGALPGGQTKIKPIKFIKVYKNGIVDEKWKLIPHGQQSFQIYGPFAYSIDEKDFDTTAEYKVSYIVFDRNLFTVNPLSVKTTYAKNIRSALEDVVKKQEDNTKDISVNVGAIAELYKRIKSMGG
jgi:hypothetical protein